MASPNKSACHVIYGPLSKVVPKFSEHHARGGTICGKGGLGMAAIFGPGRLIVLLWTVWVNINKFTRKDETDRSTFGWVFKES